MMRFCIHARHIGRPRGHAYPVRLGHPTVFSVAPAPTGISLWHNGRSVGRLVDRRGEVAAEGDGRCAIKRRMLWISLPGNLDPRTLNDPLILSLTGVEAPRPRIDHHDFDRMEPLSILGVQRSGTSALQVALDQTTRFKAPKDINHHPVNTLEGFYFRHVFAPYLQHPDLSPLGQHLDASFSYLNFHRWNTGVFTDSGVAPMLLDDAASHVASTFSWLAGGASAWVDKAPGWDSSLAAPLFVSFYPKGRVIFLTRPPAENVLSIARLESTLSPDLGTEKSINDWSRNCAIWNVGHYVWRHFARKLMPDHSFLEVPFLSLRSGDRETLTRLASFLSLSTAESDSLMSYLPSVPLPRHGESRETSDDRVVGAINMLCRVEARHWGYDPAAPATPPNSEQSQLLVERARSITERLLTWLGLAEIMAERIARFLIDPNGNKDQDLEDPLVVEPAVPGVLLAGLLDEAALRAPTETSVS